MKWADYEWDLMPGGSGGIEEQLEHMHAHKTATKGKQSHRHQ